MTYPRTISGAYGRDYKSGKAAKADFEANKDFKIEDFGPDMGRMINKEQFPKGATVNIRFNSMRGVTVVKVK